MVFGDRQIHITYFPYERSEPSLYAAESEEDYDGVIYGPSDGIGRWLHNTCVASQSDVEAYERWKGRMASSEELSEERGRQYLRTNDAHYECWTNMCPGSRPIEEFWKTPEVGEEQDVCRLPLLKLRLEVLRTCRQVYSEANPILWSTNTFSFEDQYSFTHFVDVRSAVQKRLLRCIRLTMVLSHPRGNMWNDALSMAVVKSLRGLRVLHVHIRHRFHEESSLKRWNVSQTMRNQPVQALLRLQTLPLEIVTVIFDKHPQSSTSMRRAVELRVSSYIRTQLLVQDGLEAYKERVENEKEPRHPDVLIEVADALDWSHASQR